MEFEELIAAAEAETGLTDFGDPSFRKALEVLVTSLDDEAELNDIGRAALPADREQPGEPAARRQLAHE